MINSNGKGSGGLHSTRAFVVSRQKRFFIMHEDDIEQEHNLYDPEHPEWFIYDPELLNAWYWEQFEIELES